MLAILSEKRTGYPAAFVVDRAPEPELRTADHF